FYYSLPWNTLDSGRKLFAKVDEKAGQSKIIRPGEMWQCEVKAGQVFDSFFWTRIDDGTNTFVLEEELNAKLKIISSTIAEAQSPSFAKFINKSNVTVDYPLNADGEQYRPVNIEVMILDTDNLISDLNINVTSSDSYNGHYNSIGVIAIDSNGEWSTNSRRNGYRLDDGTNTYCVYSDSLNAWVLIVTNVDHNHVGSVTGGTPVNLYNDGQLPESYGIYTVDNNLDAIESEYFNKADVDVDYHTNSESNSYFTVNFGTAKPAGIVFYK
ncbi:MAG: hypothetical protein GY881_06840, partial [Gammaproteobacteria bacterium]|nr:hypothetical protein [Gammaproteobacteria bacterium]